MCNGQISGRALPIYVPRVAGIAFVLSAMSLASLPVIANDSGCGFLLESRFVESAPRDSFVFTQQSIEDWSIASIEIDISTSAGRLIFDTTDTGAGVEVFQPFKVKTMGAPIEAKLSELPVARGSDRGVLMAYASFPNAAQFSFTIDVDGQLPVSELGQIRVSGSEIAGSVLNVTIERAEEGIFTLQGVYGIASRASIAAKDC